MWLRRNVAIMFGLREETTKSLATTVKTVSRQRRQYTRQDVLNYQLSAIHTQIYFHFELRQFKATLSIYKRHQCDDFHQITHYISKNDRKQTVSIEGEYEVVCALSNGDKLHLDQFTRAHPGYTQHSHRHTNHATCENWKQQAKWWQCWWP